MRSRTRLSVAALVAASMLLPVVSAQADDTTVQFPDSKPDVTSLLGEFNSWWTPEKVVENTPQTDAFHGTVTNPTILGANDDLTVAINKKAAEDSDKVDGTRTQAQRAATDAADDDTMRQYTDVFGDTIGSFVEDGLTQGKLPKTDALLFDEDSSIFSPSFNGTGSAKTDFNYVRPYMDETKDGWDRSMSNTDNPNELDGLKANLGIQRIAPYADPATGETYEEDYTDVKYKEGGKPSQSFPSGHTTKAYNLGIGLATLMPELGTEFVTRASEAGNNRIVLGVHYPLDVIGGRISATADTTALWSDETFRNEELLPAHDELESYIAQRCKADKLGDTVAACLDTLRVNDDKGYANSFTDDVSTEPVTDRASAITAYTSRMTYNFDQIGSRGQAPVVPDGSENLLLTAFPDLTDAQRKQVLEASEIESGYPLDASSEGYQRLNLAKAYSANVTLSEDGNTVLAITFGNTAPAVTKVSSTDAITSLLSDFSKYWKAGVGVTDEGVGVLKHDDALTESINQKAAAEGADGQDERAVADAQMNSTNTLYDALGPVLGAYYKEGMSSGKLPATTTFLETANSSASTGAAKAFYQHPRPYVDRENYVGTTLDLNGLKQTLKIEKVAAYENFDWGDGEPADNEYEGLYNSGSFPSGHTTFAFTQGAGLATILPELGAQIMTRVSEAGNNRIVLGVHYPLDIMGGHIAGQYGVATALNDPKVQQEAKAARTELVSYLEKQCKADGNGSTLAACIAATGANNENGYKNSFTDDVSKKPVTDLKSALNAYKTRMTYGFATTGARGQSAVVPDAAVNLVRNIPGFSTLSDQQLKQVLAKTETDSGYPLDDSSKGWARVDLPAVYSARVTLDAAGNVVNVEVGQPGASVVRLAGNVDQTGSAQGGLAQTGATTGVIAIVLMVSIASGVTVLVVRRMQMIR